VTGDRGARTRERGRRLACESERREFDARDIVSRARTHESTSRERERLARESVLLSNCARRRRFQRRRARAMATLRLRDLIRRVRECKTAAEERAVVAREASAIRESLRDPDHGRFVPRNVAKLMFMHMLGYPTHFGQMECVRLTARAGFPEKRVGYLGLMLLLDEDQEVTMLVTNSVKNDLSHKNHYVVGLGLCMLGSICSAEMARDVAGEVEGLLSHANSYVRKKAALTATRVIKKVPELCEGFVDSAEKLLSDRHHGVLLAACTLATEMCEMDAEVQARMRRQVPQLCKVLKSLIYAGKSAEHDIAGHADPFLQVAILRLLRVLGRGDADASDAMSDILAQIASNTDGSKNAGNAILYEAVETIIAIEAVGGLRVLAVNILGRFLQNKDNNIRYVALNTLVKVVEVDMQAIQRHRSIIVNCVKDADVTIRRSALQLVYSLVNAKNVTTLTVELLEYLEVCDEEFKRDLAKKTSALALKYSPSKQWYIDTFIALLVRAGQYIDEFECNDFMGLVARTPPLHGYTGRALYRAACEDDAKLTLCGVATWVCGEYSDAMVHAPHIEGETLTKIKHSDVTKLMVAMLNEEKYTRIRPLIMTALAKIAARDPNEQPTVMPILAKFEKEFEVETQKRASEYKRMLEELPDLREVLFEHIPPPEAPKFVAADTMETLAKKKEIDATKPAKSFGDLLNFDDDASAPSQTSGIDLLNDLLGGDGAVSAPVTPAKTNSAVDLLGDVPPATAPPKVSAPDALADLLGDAHMMPSTAPTTPAKESPQRDILGDLMSSEPTSPAPATYDPFANMGGAPPAAVNAVMDLMGDAAVQPSVAASPAKVTPTTAPSTQTPAPAYVKGGLSIFFTASKPNPLDPTETLVNARYVNAGEHALENFSLQAAVPKTMTLAMQIASGSTIAPGATVTQTMTVSTTAEHASKPIAMRVKLAWIEAGQQVNEMATISKI